MQNFYECETKHGTAWTERGEVLAPTEALAATELVRDLAMEFPDTVGLRWEIRVRLRESEEWAYFERRARNVIIVDDLQPNTVLSNAATTTKGNPHE